ncbi:MAG TPA: GNAT family N-acetyltransferase [Thermoleophilaceae bacterium]
MSAPVQRERVADLDAVREDWSRLAEEAGNPFSTWEWASIWWRHFGAGRALAVERCRVDGRAVAILPLYEWRSRPLRALRFVGHGVADQLGPVCAADDRPHAASALREAFAESRAQLLVADRLAGEQGWPPLLGGRLMRTEASPVLEAGGADFAGWLASRSKNFRDQAKRRERKLRREHERVEFRLTEDPGRLEGDFETLVRLHDAHWGERSRAFGPERRAFHRDFAHAALERGWLRLWTLEVDSRPAAAWLGYRFGGIEWYYQAGRDPALERENVGFVLLVHTIRTALDDGMREYRLLLGGESYKDRFANADHGLETVALGRGARGRAAIAAVAAADRGPEPVRRRMKSLL